MSGRTIACGTGVGSEFLCLLPFERGVGASPLPVKGIGKEGVSFGIARIRVDGGLKLDDRLSDLASLEKRLT